MRRRKVMEIKSIKIKDAYEKYLLAKKAEGLSSKTLDTYMLHIDHFMENFGNYFTTSQLSEEMYNNEIIELQEDESKSDVTVTSYCRSIRAFILQFSKKPKEDYILWEKDHDYEPIIEKELITR